MKTFLSIKHKLLIFSLCITLLPITAITTTYHLSTKDAINHLVREELRSLAESKRLHILSFMQKIKMQTIDFSSDGFIRNKLWIISRRDTVKNISSHSLNQHLKKNKMPLHSHLAAIVITDKRGNVVSSTEERFLNHELSNQDKFDQVINMRYGTTFVGQPYYDHYLGTNCICISSPVVSLRGTELLGVIVNFYSLASLDEITTNHDGMGSTGEVYLVSKDKTMLTASRFIVNTPLKQLVDTEPVHRIVESGEEMVGIYRDYRNIPVIGASSYIQEYGWILLAEIDKEEAFASLKSLYIVTLACVAFVLSITTGIGINFAISTSRPIEDLTLAVKRFANGIFDYRVKIPRKDEIGVLAHTFNTMADKLAREIAEHKQAKDNLMALNESLEKRVTERTEALRKSNSRLQTELVIRKRIANELRKQQNRLKHLANQLAVANKDLEAFCYSVSHDLQAPLRRINGFCAALLEDCHDCLDARGKNHLHHIISAGKHMEQLITALLNLSNITHREIKMEKIDLSALATSITTEIQQTQPERQAEVIIANGLTVEGDPQLIRIAIGNLLNNAWKFTGKRRHAKIELGITQHKGKPAYFIRDNGAGFDMASGNKLFCAFHRLHTDTEFEGTGIGLTIVQRIIHRHGGTIWAEAEADKGATFYFTL